MDAGRRAWEVEERKRKLGISAAKEAIPRGVELFLFASNFVLIGESLIRLFEFFRESRDLPV